MHRRAERSLPDRLLNLFAEVHPGEAGSALMLTASVFLLLTSYYVIKPVREALILTSGGAEVKSYAAAGQAVLFLFAVPAYARLASRLPRLRLIGTVTLFFAGCLVAFYLLAQTGVPVAIPFYLWVGIFNMMIVAQFWSFAIDVYSPAEGQRLFAILGFGASAGAVFGSFAAGRLFAPLGVHQLLLLAAGLLLASLGLTHAAAARRRQDALRAPMGRPAPAAPSAAPRAEAQAPADERPLGRTGAFALIRRNRYLWLIAALMVLANWVNTTGEYLLGRVVRAAAQSAVDAGTAGGLTTGQLIGTFYADFFTVVNMVGLVTQLFLVSRLIKHLGVRICVLILPAVALGGYFLLAFLPVLAVVRWAKTAENATDYSLQNTVRNVLWLPTSREEKYKAKQAIDTICVRSGDVLSAALVYVGAGLLSFSITDFALVNLVLVALWLAVAAATGRRYQQLRSGEGAPGAQVSGGGGEQSPTTPNST